MSADLEAGDDHRRRVDVITDGGVAVEAAVVEFHFAQIKGERSAVTPMTFHSWSVTLTSR